MLCAPVVSNDVLICACPLTRGVEISTVLPSLIVSLPVGVAAAGEVTTAVSVTVWPEGAGLSEDVRVVRRGHRFDDLRHASGAGRVHAVAVVNRVDGVSAAGQRVHRKHSLAAGQRNCAQDRASILEGDRAVGCSARSADYRR